VSEEEEDVVLRNPEENNIVLEITCVKFTLVSSDILGMRVCQTSIIGGIHQRERQLHMQFTRPLISNKNRLVANHVTGNIMINSHMDLEFRALLNCRVLHWWDPAYPKDGEQIHL